MWSALRPLAPRLGAHRAVWLVATIHPAAVRAKRARVRRCTSLPCASPVCASPFLGSVGSLPMQSARRPLAPRLGARDITLVATRRCAFSQHARRCRTLCASPLCASTLCVSSPSCRSCCLHILASRALLCCAAQAVPRDPVTPPGTSPRLPSSLPPAIAPAHCAPTTSCLPFVESGPLIAPQTECSRRPGKPEDDQRTLASRKLDPFAASPNPSALRRAAIWPVFARAYSILRKRVFRDVK